MVFSGVVNWPNSELKQRRIWTAHVDRKWGLFHCNVPSCDATTFVLRLYFFLMNLLVNAKSPLLIGVRAQDSVFVNQHNKNFRFEFPTTSSSEWISIFRSSQTNTTTWWGKSKLFENFFKVVSFHSVLFLELKGSWAESKNDSKGKVNGWRRSMYLWVALSLNKKSKHPSG